MRSRRADGMTTTMMLTGYTWASTAQARGPAKEQEGVHGVGAVGQHTKQRAHENNTRTSRATGEIYLGTPAFARPEFEAE